jgi:carbonic anhydrase
VRTLDLSIVGYVACGPIRAVTCNYSRESDAIKHELNGKQIAIKADEISEDDCLRGVISNVNNQVNYALIKFADEVKESILTIVGAVYDFQNVLGQGQGRLVIININGNVDTKHISAKLLELR